jgi:hypothetical protein
MMPSNVATAVGFGGRSDRPRMRLVSSKPVTKGNLRGFATVELPIGLTIFDCRVLVGNNAPWAVLPLKSVLDSEERHVKSDGHKGQYAPVLQWRNKDLANRFSDTLVALALEEYPDGLHGAT